MYSVSVLFVSLISKNIHSSIFVDFLVSTDLIFIFLFICLAAVANSATLKERLDLLKKGTHLYKLRDKGFFRGVHMYRRSVLYRGHPPLQAQGQRLLQGGTHVQKVSTVYGAPTSTSSVTRGSSGAYTCTFCTEGLYQHCARGNHFIVCPKMFKCESCR